MNRFMNVIAAAVILVTASSAATAQSAKPPTYIKVAGLARKWVPLMEWVKTGVDAVDELTKKRSEVVVQVVERGFREKGQFVTGMADQDVFVEVTEASQRGAVKQQLTMPCTATLAIDLDMLLANAMYNPATNTVEVYLPPLSIIAVENHNSKYTTSTTYSGLCWQWYDSGWATALEVDLLKSDWGALARQQIDPNAPHAQLRAMNEATRFLHGLLDPIKPGVKIVVTR